jgi:hypothetical protein
MKRGENSDLNCFNLVDPVNFEVNLDYGGSSATSERFCWAQVEVKSEEIG